MMASSKRFAEGMYGVIQSVMLVPVCISFATIIFRDPFFSPHLPALIKLVMFSCTIHQMVFTGRSTLPFAVGQVQDAGLIFLSAMASSIVSRCQASGADDYSTMATVLVTLSLSTFALGLMLILLGSLKLASFVQYLPMPVVGGYLAYIGFFCGEAGLALMAGVQIVSIADWYKLANLQSLIFISPGILLGLTLYMTIRSVKHMLTMPVFLLSVLALFYTLLFATNTSLEQTRDDGWVAPRTAMAPCYEGWKYLDLSLVHWEVVPTQVLSWVAMVLVVAFSSSLDVAAIEMEIGKPLDYDKELTTVGISNTLSGVTGGYTGSYIFSQTIFSLRAKVESRLTGMVIVLFEALIFALPFSPIAYVPKCFFGSLLLLIAIDLIHEWLIEARHKLGIAEYTVNLATFIACLAYGVEKGIVLGLVCAMAAFIVSYAQVPSIVTSSLMPSNVVRTFEERMLLKKLHHRVMTLSMNGYIFFASSVRLLEDAKQIMAEHHHHPDVPSPPSSSGGRDLRRRSSKLQRLPPPQTDLSYSPVFSRTGRVKQDRQQQSGLMVVVPPPPPTVLTELADVELASQPSYSALKTVADEEDDDDCHASLSLAILDFTHTRGLDASAARSCFLMLKQTLRTHDIRCVFVVPSPKIKSLLVAHQVLVLGQDPFFVTMESAVEWCEVDLLSNCDSQQLSKATTRSNEKESAARSMSSPSSLVGARTLEAESAVEKLVQILQDYLQVDSDDASTLSQPGVKDGLLRYFARVSFEQRVTIFEADTKANRLYFLERGGVDLMSRQSHHGSPSRGRKQHKASHRVQRISAGGTFGETAFFLQTSQEHSAVAVDQSVCWVLTREAFSAMQMRDPKLCILIQQALIRSLALADSSFLEASKEFSTEDD